MAMTYIPHLAILPSLEAWADSKCSATWGEAIGAFWAEDKGLQTDSMTMSWNMKGTRKGSRPTCQISPPLPAGSRLNFFCEELVYFTSQQEERLTMPGRED